MSLGFVVEPASVMMRVIAQVLLTGQKTKAKITGTVKKLKKVL